MSILRIAVCDDVAIERDMLCELLQKWDKKSIIYKFSSGEELLYSKEGFDLVFLDILMCGITGMETARRLHERDCNIPIVFLTSSSDFAVESYEVNAFDYIVKPLQQKRLQTVWERFRLQYKEPVKFFVFSNCGKAVKLPYDQIEYLESDRHYVTIHIADGTTLRSQGRLDDFEKQLDDIRFLRCHQSFLINLSLTKAMDDEFIMCSGKRVAYRKRDKSQLKKVFCNYLSKNQI